MGVPISPASGLESQQSGGLGEAEKSATRLDICIDCTTQVEKDEILLKEQGDKLEKEINEIKLQGRGRLTRIFKMKQKVLGSKKTSQEPSAIRDPASGDLLVASADIKRSTLQYCVNSLKNNAVSKNVETIQKLKEYMHQLRLVEKITEEIEIDKDEFDNLLNHFSKKDTKSYDFLLKAGESYKEAMFMFCRRMIKEEQFPEEFRKTMLQMIWKGKGSADILKNSRFIHIKTVLPRTTEALVVGRMKDKILEASSIYQVGGQPGHSIDEKIFVIMSMIARIEMNGEGFILSLVDQVSLFEKEQIIDVMDCLDAVGVNRKAARCWFKLNQNTQIRVNTAAGVTAPAEAGDLVGQGTAGAGLVSQLNLDNGLQQYYAGSGNEMYYGGVRIEYTAYQDDIGKPSKGVKEAQTHMVKLAYIFQDKGLEAHPEKSGYIIFKGSKADVVRFEKELKISPISFHRFTMSRREKDKYLGQILHEDGLAASAAATVEDRAGRFKEQCSRSDL